MDGSNTLVQTMRDILNRKCSIDHVQLVQHRKRDTISTFRKIRRQRFVLFSFRDEWREWKRRPPAPQQSLPFFRGSLARFSSPATETAQSTLHRLFVRLSNPVSLSERRRKKERKHCWKTSGREMGASRILEFLFKKYACLIKRIILVTQSASRMLKLFLQHRRRQPRVDWNLRLNQDQGRYSHVE